jgi:hypothetical protein
VETEGWSAEELATVAAGHGRMLVRGKVCRSGALV